MKKHLCPKCSKETEKVKILLNDGTPSIHRVCSSCKIPVVSMRGILKIGKKEQANTEAKKRS